MAGLRTPIGAATGLATVTVGRSLRATTVSLRATNATLRRVNRVLVDGEPARVVLGEIGELLLADLQRLLGITEADFDERFSRMRDGLEAATAVAGTAVGVTATRATSQRERWADERAETRPETLRERGAELLDRSTTVDEYADEHPAYAAILDQLAPDEARILRLVADAPQAIVDIVAVNPLGRPMRELGRHITMLGPRAGLRHPERTSYYLENLIRLGIARISAAATAPDAEYDVLEAQPAVIEASRGVGGPVVRPRVVRRTVVLTEFGADFAEVCLPRRRTTRRPSRPSGPARG